MPFVPCQVAPASTGFLACAPWQLHASFRSRLLYDIRDCERTLPAITRDFREHLDPAKTLIVGFDSHFLGYRHAGYYLPEFVTVQYPEVSYNDGRRVYTMHAGETQVVRSFAAGGFDRFAIFPLPESEAHSAYEKKVQGKLPEGYSEYRCYWRIQSTNSSSITPAAALSIHRRPPALMWRTLQRADAGFSRHFCTSVELWAI